MEDDEEVSDEEDYSEDEDVYSQQSDSAPTSKDQKILKDLDSPQKAANLAIPQKQQKSG